MPTPFNRLRWPMSPAMSNDRSIARVDESGCGPALVWVAGKTGNNCPSVAAPHADAKGEVSSPRGGMRLTTE